MQSGIFFFTLNSRDARCVRLGTGPRSTSPRSTSTALAQAGQSGGSAGLAAISISVALGAIALAAITSVGSAAGTGRGSMVL
ncbi:MAG: hypothetical protein M1832_002851 [Thelocarpon impressellum]|nr:MAG: hypothetical protein M1832_002851 [Thelocarpon impressellum]